MKLLSTYKEIEIPKDIEVTIKARDITIKGPLGTIKRSFKHIPCDMKIATKEGKKYVTISMWMMPYKQAACAQSIIGHLHNMFDGVVKGHKYTMKLVYAHFPITIAAVNKGKTIEVKNFLGEKQIKRVDMREGCKAVVPNKETIEIEGLDLENVSLSCAMISQIVKIGDKDNRKFLDGIYVSAKEFTKAT
jgi:large subunit ribosomal protein L9e